MKVIIEPLPQPDKLLDAGGPALVERVYSEICHLVYIPIYLCPLSFAKQGPAWDFSVPQIARPLPVLPI